MNDADKTLWRVWTESGGLARLDPGPDRPALRAALEDCAETLSPLGEPPALSTYWLDRMLELAKASDHAEIAHGNLWVLTAHGGLVEVRMDVDPAASEPLDLIEVEELTRGLRLLRTEVLTRLAEGHQLAERSWVQKNPA